MSFDLQRLSARPMPAKACDSILSKMALCSKPAPAERPLCGELAGRSRFELEESSPRILPWPVWLRLDQTGVCPGLFHNAGDGYLERDRVRHVLTAVGGAPAVSQSNGHRGNAASSRS